jgi:hypothetical protein
LEAVLPAVLEADFVDFAAVFEAADLDPDFEAEDLAPAFFEAVVLEPELLEAELFEVDFAALLLALVPLLFFAPDFAGDFALCFPLVELRRALLFADLDLVLVAPVSPVNNIVSGFDFSSVGIAASFKGLRVQPSRLQGNVVIPSEFRLTESVANRTRTISVDIFTLKAQ